jgi:hypothetical protein
MIIYSRVLAFGTAILGFAAPCYGGDSLVKLKERFFAEAPKGWGELESEARRIEMAGTSQVITTRADPNLRRAIVRKFSFSRNGDMALYHIKEKSLDGKPIEGEFVVGTNGTYRFFLTKTADQKTFLLKDFGAVSSEHTNSVNQFMDNFLSFPWSICNHKLSLLVKSRGFKLIDIKDVRHDGRQFARIEFRDTPPDNGQGPLLRGGWVILSPEDHWAMQQYEVDLSTEKVSGEAGYVEDTGRFKPMKYVSIVTVRPSKEHSPITFEWRCDFDDWKYRVVPESRFMLPAFGLPELETTTKPNGDSHREYYYIALGLLLFALAAYVKKSGR